MRVTHSKVSAKADGPDTSLVLPSEWNADHVIVSAWKAPVRLATAAALPANTRTGNVLLADANGALGTIDGVTAAVSDRVLVKNEGAKCGIYVIDSVGSAGSKWQMTRATDADSDADVVDGLATYVAEGNRNRTQVWALATNNPITLNTTALGFAPVGIYINSDVTSLSGSAIKFSAGDIGAEVISLAFTGGDALSVSSVDGVTDPLLRLTARASGTGGYFIIFRSGESYGRVVLGADTGGAGKPGLQAGPGSGVPDVILYRNAADEWAMDDALTLGGPLALTNDVANTTTGTQTNITLAALTAVFRWNGASASSLTSFTGGRDGRILVIQNATAAQTLSLLHDDGVTGTAANRLYLPAGATLAVDPNSSVALQYDATSSRWRALVPGAYQAAGSYQALVANLKVVAVTLAAGATVYIADADILSSGAAVFRGDGNDGGGGVAWYRAGTYNVCSGWNDTLGNYGFQGTTFSAGAATVASFFIESNSAGARLGIKNNSGSERTISLLCW
jgi:hypothetical protein